MAIVFACLIWPLILLWVMASINWAVMGEIDWGTAILSIAVGFTLGYFTTVPPVPALSGYLFFSVLGTIVLFPLARKLLHGRLLAQLDLEVLENSYQTLRHKPDNVGSVFRIARLIYERGLQGHAIALTEQALQRVPKGLFQDEERMIQRWRMTPTPPEGFRMLPCLRCQTHNAPGLLFCPKCGSPFLLDYANGRWGGKPQKRLFAAWLVAILTLVGIPLASQALAPGLAIGVILLLVGLGCWLLVSAFRGAVGS